MGVFLLSLGWDISIFKDLVFVVYSILQFSLCFIPSIYFFGLLIEFQQTYWAWSSVWWPSKCFTSVIRITWKSRRIWWQGSITSPLWASKCWLGNCCVYSSHSYTSSNCAIAAWPGQANGPSWPQPAVTQDI